MTAELLEQLLKVLPQTLSVMEHEAALIRLAAETAKETVGKQHLVEPGGEMLSPGMFVASRLHLAEATWGAGVVLVAAKDAARALPAAVLSVILALLLANFAPQLSGASSMFARALAPVAAVLARTTVAVQLE